MPLKPKPASRQADHKIYGPGEVLAVRILDNGKLVADVRFEDGLTRCIRLSQEFWLSPIADLTPTPPPKPKRTRKAAPAKQKPARAEHQLADSTEAVPA